MTYRVFAPKPRHSTLRVLAAGVSIAALSAGAARAVPVPTRQTPAAADAGVESAAAPVTLTVALKLRDPAGAEAMLRRVSTPGASLYKHFLTTAQFQKLYGPTDDSVASVSAGLAASGLTVQRIGTTLLQASGSLATVERTFNVSLHHYTVAATASAAAYSFHAPVRAATIPAAMIGTVAGVFGLDDRPALSPHLLHTPGQLRPSHTALPAAGAPNTPDAPGEWTTLDFADYYAVNPLYHAGATGAGQTIGIITFASFTPSDAYTYWKSIGLHVNQNRIRQINVAGGDGAPSDDAGSGETTLDVEQSGGIAPGARVLVYEAPNTTNGFVQNFSKAIDENLADAISCSWGSWEWYDNLQNSPVRLTGSSEKISTLDAVHALLVQAGTQGESVFTSSGDSGAYDANDFATPPDYSLALSVDYPASDTAITAAGGTTLPGTQTYPNENLTVTIPAERAWSWDYLIPLCDYLGYDQISCGIFPVGSGGGVSFEFAVPDYQNGVAGVQVTQPNQVFSDTTTAPPTTIYALPSGYAGRNVPDVSFNADPDTGYIIGYTSSASGSSYGIEDYYGGTSFVAPQLNGVTQLLMSYTGGRLGFVNPMFYSMASTSSGYHGSTAPFRYTPAGNNDFYDATRSYNPAVGLGVLNVTRLARALMAP